MYGLLRSGKVEPANAQLVQNMKSKVLDKRMAPYGTTGSPHKEGVRRVQGGACNRERLCGRLGKALEASHRAWGHSTIDDDEDAGPRTSAGSSPAFQRLCCEDWVYSFSASSWQEFQFYEILHAV